MKRIVFIGSGLSSGGAEHQCAQLMNMLIDRGYDVTYASYGDVDDHYYVSPKVRRDNIAPHMSIHRKILDIELYLLRIRADVVFAFSQRNSVLALFPLLLRPKVKVISGERNFTIAEPDKYEKILIKTGIYRRANFIVPNNFSQGKHLTKVMPSIKDKIRVITNYTDVEVYRYASLPENDIPRIGVFCRLEAQKNFHRFIEALHILDQESKLNFKVDWYGNHTFRSVGQKAYFEDGIRMIKKFNLENIIVIHDATHDVPNLIPKFDVMCLPSLHEGFSNSISEYISCGRPVICSNVSDNSVMVHEGVNGFLFNPLDVHDIAMAIKKYLNTSKDERETMSLKSREIAESLFNKEKFINNYLRLIEA